MSGDYFFMLLMTSESAISKIISKTDSVMHTTPSANRLKLPCVLVSSKKYDVNHTKKVVPLRSDLWFILYNYFYATETVSFKPSGCIIFNNVSIFGVVLNVSILATDDCGIPHISAKSL